MRDRAASLDLSQAAAKFLADCPSDRRMAIWTLLFSILREPEMGFNLPCPPYRPGAKGFGEHGWFFAYRETEFGDVRILQIDDVVNP